MNDEARAVWERLAGELELDERFFHHALPCVRIDDIGPWSQHDEAGTSRLGGPPDLPPELEWPVVDGVRLELVMQIDLGALAPRVIDALPARGWLWLFVGDDEPGRDLVHRVLVWNGPRERLRQARPPEGREPHWAAAAIHPQRVRFEAGITLALDESGDRELAEAIEDAVDAAPDELSTESARVGGHPATFDRDLRVDAHLVRSGRSVLRDRTHLDDAELATQIRDAWAAMDDERATELELARELLTEWHTEPATHRAEIARWRSLLVIESTRAVEHLWWDGGLLEVLIDERDLAIGRFDRTYCGVHST